MEDGTSWSHRDDPASRIKQIIQGIAIYSEIAVNDKNKSQEEGDEHDLAATKYFNMRNESMREVHRLADELTLAAKSVILPDRDAFFHALREIVGKVAADCHCGYSATIVRDPGFLIYTEVGKAVKTLLILVYGEPDANFQSD